MTSLGRFPWAFAVGSYKTGRWCVTESNGTGPLSHDMSQVVAVVGLGKIGLPVSIAYIRRGWRVIGCDVNPHVVNGLNAGKCHIEEEPGLAPEVATAVARGR